MNKFWNKYAPYCHFAGWFMTIIFLAGMKWGDVSGYEGRLAALELQIKGLPVLQQRVEDIAEFLGVPKHHE